MIKIKIFSLEKKDGDLDMSGTQIQLIINTWLCEHQNIKIVSTNVSSGGMYTTGEKYYLLYEENDIGNDADETD